MIVKIGNKCYDSNQEPIMVILSNDDKELIGSMAPDAFKYCSYPECGYTEDEICEFMGSGLDEQDA